MNALQGNIVTAANAILAGVDDAPEQAQVKGVSDDDGVFTLVLDVPEPLKDEQQ